MDPESRRIATKITRGTLPLEVFLAGPDDKEHVTPDIARVHAAILNGNGDRPITHAATPHLSSGVTSEIAMTTVAPFPTDKFPEGHCVVTTRADLDDGGNHTWSLRPGDRVQSWIDSTVVFAPTLVDLAVEVYRSLEGTQKRFFSVFEFAPVTEVVQAEAVTEHIRRHAEDPDAVFFMVGLVHSAASATVNEVLADLGRARENLPRIDKAIDSAFDFVAPICETFSRRERDRLESRVADAANRIVTRPWDEVCMELIARATRAAEGMQTIIRDEQAERRTRIRADASTTRDTNINPVGPKSAKGVQWIPMRKPYSPNDHLPITMTVVRGNP